MVIGYWLLDIGYWLLDIGYWILVIGYWLLVIMSTKLNGLTQRIY
jgi:hypothetical protein